MKILVKDLLDKDGHAPAEKELVAMSDNGIEYTAELLGNHGIHANADGVVEMDTETWLWWQNYLADAAITEQDVEKIVDLLADDFESREAAKAYVLNEIVGQANELAAEREIFGKPE